MIPARVDNYDEISTSRKRIFSCASVFVAHESEIAQRVSYA